MKKIVKLFLLSIAIFTTSFIGVTLSNVEASQIDFCAPINTTTTPPSSYDLRDYIDIGVENQNPYGICYAYASLTSLETYLALNYGEYYDFSEIHFALSLCLQSGYYNTIEDAFVDGGNFTHFITYTQKDKSLVLESEMPMNKYLALSSSKRFSTMENDYNNINANFYPIVKVNDTKTFPQYSGDKSQYSTSELTNFRNSIKTHIMQYGSLSAGIYTSASTFTNGTINLRITDDSLVTSQTAIISNINHLISIVGWDDNYDADGAWENKGAYICLNSWGTSFGEDGYFYVSYDDYFIETSIQGVSNATLSTTHNKISTISNHQNNTFIVTHTLNSNLYLANIFDTTNYVGESIEYIDTFVKGGTTKFYISFFNNKSSALSGMNSVSVMNIANSAKVDEYSIYYKYKLNSPLEITNNFMVIVTEVKSVTKTHSLAGYLSKSPNLEPTYYSTSQLGNFSTSRTWNSAIGNEDLELTLPLILHTNTTYIECSQFSSDIESLIDSKYIQNNSIFYNKPLQLTLTNANISEEDLDNIKITKLYNNSFSDVTSNFEVSKISSTTITITMTNDVNGNFNQGNYLVSIPYENIVIYRVIQVQDIVTYSITYHLNGGTANNINVFTNKHSSLTLNSPIKDGYIFVGWYTDSEFNNKFDTNALTYANLDLYAKYDFAPPTITSKTKDISITYYDGLEQTIAITANHSLINEFNALNYQWYMRKSLDEVFTKIEGATNNSLRLYNVSDSGYYTCEVSILITDSSLVDTPCAKVLQANSDNQILVNIKPFTYDISNTKWNYTEAISYDTNTHIVELLNIPEGVTVVYSQNSHNEIGTYTAHAEFIYDDKNGNVYVPPIEDLNWEIRKAKITITLKDILSKNTLSNKELSSRFSCTIDNEYLPDDIISLQDKINYLELEYQLQDTHQSCIKIITATTKPFDIYDIIIIDAKYQILIDLLTYNNITSTSTEGFVRDCVFMAENVALNNDVNKLLNNNHLILIDSYNISYSYIQDDNIATINIPVDRDLLFNSLSVYMLKDNKLIKVDNILVSLDGISFTTSEQDATYIITTDDLSYNSNTEILIVTCIITIYIVIYIYVIIVAIRHKRDEYI